MSIRFLYGSEKTNSYYPTPWAFTQEPFPAFRGSGQRYNAFLAVANGFLPRFSHFDLSNNQAVSDTFSKIIKTKKGTQLLVPCSKDEDERILLITARGGFRGSFGVIEGIGAEILWQNSMSMHCCPVAHIIARVTENNGYVRTETGRRCSYGYTEVYSWKGGYFGMDTKEYEATIETGYLFAKHNTIESDLASCRAKAEAEQASCKAKKEGLGNKILELNARLVSCESNEIILEETYFNAPHLRLTNQLYTQENIEKAEKAVMEVEKQYGYRKAEEKWRPKFQEAIANSEFAKGKDPWRDNNVTFCTNLVSVYDHKNGKFVRYEWSESGLLKFISDLSSFEEYYLIKQSEKTQLEAEAKVKAELEAKRREEEAKAKAAQEIAEAEAKEMSLPSDIRIWHRYGATNAGKGWVIRPNGMERECDWIDKRGSIRNSDGYYVWNQILPGEVVLRWAHAYTAAEHEFEVIYCPEALSPAQIERIAEIEKEIEDEYFGRTGLTGTYSCPSIGDGWGLIKK